MKYRIIPLLVAGVVLLTSMSDCDGNFFTDSFKDPVYAVIDGVQYEAEEEVTTTHHHNNKMPCMTIHEDYFTFWLGNKMTGGEKKPYLRLNHFSYEPFELNKRYPLVPGTLKPEHSFYEKNLSDIREYSGDKHYLAISGWIEFTDTTYNVTGRSVFLSGKFEFDAKDIDSDEVVKVTGGEFGPMLINYVVHRPVGNEAITR